GLEDQTLALVDTRPVDQVHAGTVPGALSIPSLGQAATHIAWAFDPESDEADLVVLADDAQTAAVYGDHFVRVGVDTLIGYVSSLEGLPTSVPQLVSPAGLARLRAEEPDALLLDVRNRSEHAAGTVPGAEQLSAGKVLFHQDELPTGQGRRVISFCQTGMRNSVAAAALRRACHDVVELDGSYSAWARWDAAQNEPAAEEMRASLPTSPPHALGSLRGAGRADGRPPRAHLPVRQPPPAAGPGRRCGRRGRRRRRGPEVLGAEQPLRVTGPASGPRPLPEGRSLCAEPSPVAPAAKQPGPAAASTWTRSCATCRAPSAAKDTRTNPPAPGSSHACSGAEPHGGVDEVAATVDVDAHDLVGARLVGLFALCRRSSARCQRRDDGADAA